MTQLRLDNPLWQFSLEVYAAEGVAAECIAVQDAHGVDVNVLLFAAWLGTAHRRTLHSDDIEAMRSAASKWQHGVVEPLRKVRQDMKVAPEIRFDDVQALRKQIAELELRAEQVEQAMLFTWAEGELGESAAVSSDAARSNVEGLLRSYGCEPAKAESVARLLAEAATGRTSS